jgi:hypothetical protein
LNQDITRNWFGIPLLLQILSEILSHNMPGLGHYQDKRRRLSIIWDWEIAFVIGNQITDSLRSLSRHVPSIRRNDAWLTSYHHPIYN